MHAGMRAKGPKADLALITADGDAVAAGVFTTNVMAAAPVTYCREVLARTDTVRAVSPAPDLASSMASNMLPSGLTHRVVNCGISHTDYFRPCRDSNRQCSCDRADTCKMHLPAGS